MRIELYGPRLCGKTKTFQSIVNGFTCEVTVCENWNEVESKTNDGHKGPFAVDNDSPPIPSLKNFNGTLIYTRQSSE